MMNVIICCSVLLFYFMIKHQIYRTSMSAGECYLQEKIEQSKIFLLQQNFDTTYQTSCFPSKNLEQQLSFTITVPSLTNWGWIQTSEESYQPVWTTIPKVSKHSVELTSCICHKQCKSERCKYVKMGIRCTKLCVCKGIHRKRLVIII